MPTPYPGMLSNKTAIPKTQPAFGLGSFQSPQAVPTPQPMQAPQAPAMQTPQTSNNYQDMGAADQFKLFQSNPEVGQSEIARATNQANIYKATGDMDKYNAAKDWLGKVNTVMAGVQTPKPVNPYEQQQAKSMQDYNDTLGQFRQQLATPFAYNPATDPQAQAYKAVYDNQAKEGSRNAMEAMNSRGLLNSSMTAGEIAKAEQDAGLQYGAKLADLGQQAYQRNQDSIQNTGKLLGFVGDQQQRSIQQGQWSQDYALRQRADTRAQQGQSFNQDIQTKEYQNKIKQQHIDQANYYTDKYGIVVDPKEDFSNVLDQIRGLPTAAQKTAAQKAESDRKAEAWKVVEALGEVPSAYADILGIPAGTQTQKAKEFAADTAYKNRSAATQERNATTAEQRANAATQNAQTNADKANNPKVPKTNKNDIESEYMHNIEQMTPQDKATFFKAEKANIVKDLGIAGYNSLYNMHFDKWGDPK